MYLAHDRIILCVASLCLSHSFCICVYWMLCVCFIADRFFFFFFFFSSCVSFSFCCCFLSISSSYSSHSTTLLPYWNSDKNSLSLNLKCCYPSRKKSVFVVKFSHTHVLWHTFLRNYYVISSLEFLHLNKKKKLMI